MSHKLPAGRELDRMIAERVGYHPVDIGDGYWSILPPKDSNQSASKPMVSIELAWEFAKNIPPYSTNTDTALTLFDDVYHAELEMQQLDRGGLWRVWVGSVHRPPTGDAESLALAICYAWLTWKDDPDGRP